MFNAHGFFPKASFAAGYLLLLLCAGGLLDSRPAAATDATGGNSTIIDGSGYRIHTFTSSGTLTVNTMGNVQVLVVAGGGGGGSSSFGGGGRAGGLIYNS